MILVVIASLISLQKNSFSWCPSSPADDLHKHQQNSQNSPFSCCLEKAWYMFTKTVMSSHLNVWFTQLHFADERIYWRPVLWLVFQISPAFSGLFHCSFDTLLLFFDSLCCVRRPSSHFCCLLEKRIKPNNQASDCYTHLCNMQKSGFVSIGEKCSLLQGQMLQLPKTFKKIWKKWNSLSFSDKRLQRRQ